MANGNSLVERLRQAAKDLDGPVMLYEVDIIRLFREAADAIEELEKKEE